MRVSTLLVALVFLFSGCGISNEGGAPNIIKTAQNVEQMRTGIQDEWMSQCFQMSEQGQFASEEKGRVKMELRFGADESLQVIVHAFAEEDCGGAVEVLLDASGKYRVTGNGALEASWNAELEVNQLNQGKLDGFTPSKTYTILRLQDGILSIGEEDEKRSGDTPEQRHGIFAPLRFKRK